MNPILILLAGILVNATGSLLVKHAVDAGPLPLDRPLALLGNLPLLAGLACFGLTFVLYVCALSRLPLGIVHPVMTAGAIAVVALASALWLREVVSLTWVAGIVLIVAGVVLVTMKAPSA